MSSGTHPVGVRRIQGETVALTTSVAVTGLRPNHHQLILYNPVEDWRLHFNPALIDVNYFDTSAAVGSKFVKNGSTNTLVLDLVDRNSATGTGTVMDSGASGDFLYLCFSDVTAGISINVKSANGTANTMTVQYRKNDGTWASLSIIDNTDTGASLAQDGTVTWTAPTDFQMVRLGGSQGVLTDSNVEPDTSSDPVIPPGIDPSSKVGFWLRLSWDNGLDSDTEIEEIVALNKDTNRGFFRAGVEYDFSIDPAHVGSFEAVTTANTDTLQVTHVRVVD